MPNYLIRIEVVRDKPERHVPGMTVVHCANDEEALAKARELLRRRLIVGVSRLVPVCDPREICKEDEKGGAV